jgi:hypothetical protein
MTTRRGFITGLIALGVTAPAIVRAGSLMPVKTMIEPVAWSAIDLGFPSRRRMMYWMTTDGLYCLNGDGILARITCCDPEKL